MIHFTDVTLRAKIGDFRRTVFERATLSIPSDRRVALFASNSEDRIAILNLLAGVIPPAEGTVVREKRVSFPGDLLMAFDGTITLRNNLRYVAEIYGANRRDFLNFFERMAGLGDDWEKLFGELSRDYRRQITQVASLSLPFDVYLSSGIHRAGPPRLVELAQGLFEIRRQRNGIILGERKPTLSKQFDVGLVLRNGRLRLVKDVDRAMNMVHG